jgi:hypothetical protein
MTPEILKISVGDLWLMKRVHACGGNRWEVFRIGADIGMQCLKCKHRVLIARKKFTARAKIRISKTNDLP